MHHAVVDNRVTEMEDGLPRGPADAEFSDGEIPGVQGALKMAAASGAGRGLRQGAGVQIALPVV